MSFFHGFWESEGDDNGKSLWIPSLCLSDFLAVDVGLVLTLNHEDLKEEKFPPAALGPAGFKGGEVFPSEGSLRVCSAPTEQGHGVCVPGCPLLLVWSGIIDNPPVKEHTESSAR